MTEVILSYDIEMKELSVILGDNYLFITDFEETSPGIHRKLLTTYAQEKLIKRLVANMELKEATP